MKDYLKLLRFIKPHLAQFILAAIFMVFSAIFDGVSLGMIVPFTDKIMTNKPIIIPAQMPAFLANFILKINSAPPLALLKWMILVVFILFFLKGVVGFLQSYLMSDIGQKVVRDVRDALYTKIHTLSMDYFTHKRAGELVSRITNDVKLIENAVSYGSTDLIYQSAQVILFTFLIFYIYWKLALISLILLPAISFPIIKVGKILKKISYKSQEKMADINSILMETISGIRIVKAFSAQDYEINKFRDSNTSYYKLTMKGIKRVLILSPATEILGVVAGLVIVALAGRDVIAGKISFGVFGLFLGSLFSLIRPFKKLSQVNSINQQALAAVGRIYEVLNAQPSVIEKKGAKELSGFRNSIRFENVWFSYGHHDVLCDINLEVRVGEIVAIVGPSGVGKSTLVDLLPRFYDPQKGRILIDGCDIKEVTLDSLRHQIGIVSQENILFNDTIRANIAYGNPQADDARIIEAAKQAYAHDFITKLPQGYRTVIGDRGVKLSGGERQRIAVARALFKNPPILILDEATSQLDTESERLLQQALERLIQNRTVFVIAHRLSTIRDAHQIIVLDKGRIVEQGTHSQLMQKDGLYKRLIQLQESSVA
ncbi:MAG: ABC transporter ATP-binding protein/permease [Candidatus Omnitrophica bacterium]|nr:ABC transporter ATP-binding protein/permease [Candidatus Omnitrophota bacterium]MCM8771068.1 ABC transporter ATP-binding protein/permease [Candidatus Omnitrophota bacterium]